MELHHAQELATQWKTLLSPACVQIEPAGGVRRKKAEVHDIDLVCQPIITYEPDLFGQQGTQVNKLESLLHQTVLDMGALIVINGPRQKKIRLQEGIALEIWMVFEPAQWGVQLMIRTGPSDFSKWMVTPRQAGGGLPSYLRVKDGAIWRYDRRLPTPTEDEVFALLGMDYIEPAKRRARWMGSPA